MTHGQAKTEQIKIHMSKLCSHLITKVFIWKRTGISSELKLIYDTWSSKDNQNR
jgi:hypothetical protein